MVSFIKKIFKKRKLNMDVEYYSDGGGRFLASISRGGGGFFIMYDLKANPLWEFVTPGSLKWDSFHQNLYRNQRDFDLCTDDEVKLLPELPEIPEHKRMRWKDNFLPLPEMPISEFPFLSKFLLACEHGNYRFWFVLYEDKYETVFGDGCFVYWSRRVFLDRVDAIAFVQKENAKLAEDPYGTEYSLESFALKLENGFLVPEDFLPITFKRYKIENIIRRIEDTLASNGSIPWGEAGDYFIYG